MDNVVFIERFARRAVTHRLTGERNRKPGDGLFLAEGNHDVGRGWA